MTTLSKLGCSLVLVLGAGGCLQVAGFDPKERVEATSEQDGGGDDAPSEAADDGQGQDATEDAPQDGQDEEASAPCSAGQTFVPAGTMQMGGYGYEDQQPIHEVSVKAFCMGTTEVTVAEYHECVQAKACTAAGNDLFCNVWNVGRDNHPVNCVDMAQAQQYCAWAKGKLPTEEQWEYAAKGPTSRLYPYGESTPSSTLVCWTENGTCPSDEPQADRSYFGLAGMGANVTEWTLSPYCSYTNPFCGSTQRVVRGGEWYNHDAFMVEAANRGSAAPVLSGSTVGVRCVWDPAGP